MKSPRRCFMKSCKLYKMGYTVYTFHFSNCQEFLNLEQVLFTLLHEIEAGPTCNDITLSFEPQHGSSLQIVVQLEVLDYLSLC